MKCYLIGTNLINLQLPVDNRTLIEQQHYKRVENHPYSEGGKAPSGDRAPFPDICVRDLVYLYCDRNKSQARDRYLVVSTEQLWCNIRKFKGNKLRSASYRVKKAEWYKVPDVSSKLQTSRPSSALSDDVY